MQASKIDQLYQKCLRPIKRLARRYSIKGHYLLNYEDLVSEGLLVLARVLAKNFKEEDFHKVFYTSLQNHFKSLLQTAHREKRTGYTIELEAAYGLWGQAGVDATFLSKKVEHIKLLLPGDRTLCLRLLQEILEPSPPTLWRAVQEYVRSQHLHKHGIGQARRSLRITNGNIAQTLGITVEQFNRCLTKIKRCSARTRPWKTATA